VDQYEQVDEAYLAGLEERVASGACVVHVASVASFFLSRIDTGWHAPRLAVRARGASLNEPVLHAMGRGYVVAWWEQIESDTPLPIVTRWARVDTLRPTASSDAQTLFDGGVEFTSVALHDSAVLVVSRDPRVKGQLGLAILTNRGAEAHGRLSVDDDVQLHAVNAGPAVWVLTSRLAKRPDEPPVVNLVTPVRVRCAG
jgi:hypothetical protein